MAGGVLCGDRLSQPPVRVTVELDEERIRAIVREEIAAAPAAGTAPVHAGRWMTPGQAAQACGVPTRRVTGLRRAGRIRARPRNVAVDAKQIKYEVDVESLKAALDGEQETRPQLKSVRGG